MVDPGAKHGALRCVLARDQQGAELDFEDRDDGYKEVRGGECTRPSGDVAISFVQPSQFGNDVGVEQKHQPRSADLNIPAPTRGGSNSKSAPPCASASARLIWPPVSR